MSMDLHPPMKVVAHQERVENNQRSAPAVNDIYLSVILKKYIFLSLSLPKAPILKPYPPLAAISYTDDGF